MLTCKLWEVYSGSDVFIYTLSTDKISVDISTLGGAILALRVPDKQGSLTDVVLGLTSAQDVACHPSYMGAVVGRCANRIAGGKFTLEGKTYQLAKNDNGKNHLHGGINGFNKKIYSATTCGDNALVLSAIGQSGEENYPARLDFSVKYTVEGSALKIEYFAQSDGTTVFNPTNHAYFNLAGYGDVLGHELTVYADKFLPVDQNLIPTGEERPVLGGAFDFTKPKPIGAHIHSSDPQLRLAGGYDHNFCLSGRHAATLYCPQSGIALNCYTTCPGMQLYTGNFLDGVKGKAVYGPRAGVCLETQFYPNALNVEGWQKPILHAGEKFYSETSYVFDVAKTKSEDLTFQK